MFLCLIPQNSINSLVCQKKNDICIEIHDNVLKPILSLKKISSNKNEYLSSLKNGAFIDRTYF